MPDAYLIDTGVFVRWFVPQIGYEHAREVRQSFLHGDLVMETVDFVRVEVAEVLRKRGFKDGHLTLEEYLTAVRAIDDLGIHIHQTDVEALERAALLTSRRPVRMYDALVVDRALERSLPLLTSDAKLCRAVAGLLSTELLRGIDA